MSGPSEARLRHSPGVVVVPTTTLRTRDSPRAAIRSQLDRVSISGLADRSGIPAQTFRSYRRGDRRPSVKAIEAIEAALGRMLDEAEN
jgi:hypothetical protein